MDATMAENTTTTSEPPSAPPSAPCHLLRLPTELQLKIYRWAVVADEPLLLNVPCNSSFGGKMRGLHRPIVEGWRSGAHHAPRQPALAETCRAIRELALPLFYGENAFLAHYCDYSAASRGHRRLPGLTHWLRAIGPENRVGLRHFYFFDANRGYDRWRPADIDEVRRSEIVADMGGQLVDRSPKHCCAHLLTFGEHGKKRAEATKGLWNEDFLFTDLERRYGPR